jgi:hypothetical protein
MTLHLILANNFSFTSTCELNQEMEGDANPDVTSDSCEEYEEMEERRDITSNFVSWVLWHEAVYYTADYRWSFANHHC